MRRYGRFFLEKKTEQFKAFNEDIAGIAVIAIVENMRHELNAKKQS